MQKYTGYYSKKKTSQREAIPGRESEMVKNYAGGVVFKLDDWKILDRFLILGSSEFTYYASPRKLTKENAKNILILINKDPKRVVDRVVEISNSGRAPNNDPALFVLAMVIGFADIDKQGKTYAFENLHKVARIGTHLFHFVEYVQSFRGWGRGLRNGIANWYLGKNIEELLYQVIKYQGRDGWTHRDILRKAHIKTQDERLNTIFAWITHGIGGERKNDKIKTFPYSIDDIKDLKIIYGFELAKKAKSEDEIVKLIEEYNLPREAIPTKFMGRKVYEALLPKMPIMALIRNLGNLSKVGILETGNFDEIKFVVDKITNNENLRRVHPIQLLIALKTYSSGHGVRGKGNWDVVPHIVNALDDAFYKAFKFVEPTGKRILIALDVSSSMSYGNIAGVKGLTPRAASAAMAMVTMKTEENWSIVGFTSGNSGVRNNSGISILDIHPNMRLDNVEKVIRNLPFGATDCALPAIWAKKRNKDFDAIFIYTDNETWAGRIHPVQAMRDYRNEVGHDVKLIVVGMTATEFSIADPKDKSMLDVVGFDANVPSIMSDFITNKL